MLVLTLIALLLGTPVGSDRDDDNDDDKKPPTALRDVSNYAVYDMPDQRAMLWLNFAYGTVSQYYDDDSELQDLGAFEGMSPAGPVAVDTEAEASSLVAHLGGSYDVHQIGDLDIALGADLAMAQRQLQADAVPELAPETDVSSGFSPQNLTLFGKLKAPNYTARAGYLLDLGPEIDDEQEDYNNSDRQDAILLGISGQYPGQRFRVFGGLDYFLTLQDEREMMVVEGDVVQEVSVDVDAGDIANLHLGAGFRIGTTAEVGLTLLYRINTEGEITGGPAISTRGFAQPGSPSDFASGSLLSAVPYVTYSPEDAPFQIYVKGAEQREYYDYGYALAGQNDIAPSLGVTAGITYGL